jgi:hypothetical protein
LTDVFAKYRGKDLNWSKGITCVHVARFILRKLGHNIPKLPPIRSQLGAVRALKEKGWANVTEMLDAQPSLTRIAPAQMLPGDLCASDSEDGIGAILISCGGVKVFGLHPDATQMVVIDVNMDALTGAWRV